MNEEHIIHWVQQTISESHVSESYRYERNGIRATYGNYGYNNPHWAVNDCNRKDSDFLSGDACDMLTARITAEDLIRDLQSQRGEVPATPECCYNAKKTADWNEGAGGVLYCPACGKKLAFYRQ